MNSNTSDIGKKNRITKLENWYNVKAPIPWDGTNSVTLLLDETQYLKEFKSENNITNKSDYHIFKTIRLKLTRFNLDYYNNNKIIFSIEE